MTLETPIIVGGITIERWIEGHTYEDSLGRTYYSGAEGPSEEDAADCIVNPRALPSPIATATDIKTEARRRILAIAPDWKQSNMIARTVELVRDHGTEVDDWPPSPQAENAAHQAIWDKIKAIRAHSDALESAPPTRAALPSADWPF